MTTAHPLSVRLLARSQRGVSTLLISVILFLLASVLIITVSRTTLMEQRMSANEIRTRQAFEAAQAGIDQAAVVLISSKVDANADGAADAGPSATLTGSGARYFVSWCQPGIALPANVCDTIGAPACTGVTASNFNTPLIVSCGWSDDGIGRRLIQQGIGTVSALGGTPSNPLTAKGGLNVGGSANVVNYYNNLTVWTGGSLTSIGNSGKTFVRNPTVAPPSASTPPPGPPNSCSTSTDYVCLTDKNTTGPDVIGNDPTLSNLTDAQMFTNFFGQPDLATYKAEVAKTVINASDVGTLAGKLGDSIVVTGNTTLPNATIGSREQPVVLIIDGDLEMQGTPYVYGIVYVTGNVTGGGNVTVQGAMVIEGSVSPTGSLDVIYDPLVGEGAKNTGRPGLIPGSWRDWR